MSLRQVNGRFDVLCRAVRELTVLQSSEVGRLLLICFVTNLLKHFTMINVSAIGQQSLRQVH